MAFKNFVLGALAFAVAVVARVAPQSTVVPIFPIGNGTKPTAAPTDSSCVADCRVRYPELYAVSWVPEVHIVYTTKITVGTVSVYTTISGKTSIPPRTHTVFNVDVPAEYSLWMLRSDGDGRAFVEVPLTISDRHTLKTLVYPTPWLEYPSEYHWEGVVPTTGKRGDSFCATATELDAAVLSSHPTYPQPTPKLDDEDPLGASHKPLWVPVQDEPDKKWFDATFPSVSAFASCQSVPGKPAQTEFEAAKFIFDTITYTVGRTPLPRPPTINITTINIILPTESGFEDTSTTGKISTSTKHEEITESGWETTTRTLPDISKATGPHFMTSETGFEEQPDAHQTAPPPEPTSKAKAQPTVVIITILEPNKPGAKPALTPAPAVASPTPVFTLVPSVSNGKPYASPAFVVPGSSALASVGEQVEINGTPTILTAPAKVYAIVPTIVNGVSTSKEVYIISGSITATVGQTVTIDGQPTVLPAPTPVLTMITGILRGISTMVPVYLISGSIRAFPGDTVTIDGQVTVLPVPERQFVPVTTTIDGKKTVISAYILSDGMTATIGQTVTIDGTRTVLSTPTRTIGPIGDTELGGPASTTSGGQAGSTIGSAILPAALSWGAVIAGAGAFAFFLL